MLGHLNLEIRIVWIFELSQRKFEFPLVALPNLPVVRVHLDGLFLLVLLRVFLPLLFLLVIGHLFVHFPPGFPRVGSLQLGLLLLTQMLFQFPPLLAIVLLLLDLELPLLNGLVERRLEGGKELLRLDPLRGGDEFSIVGLEGVHMSDDIVLAAVPSLAGIAGHVQLLEVGKPGEALDAVVQVSDIDEIDGHIQFLEAFASLDVLYPGDVVECKIEILQFLQFAQVLHLFDDVVLQVDDLQVPAEDVQILYLQQLLLVQRDLRSAGRYLFQRGQAALVVLRTLPQQLLGYPRHLILFKLEPILSIDETEGEMARCGLLSGGLLYLNAQQNKLKEGVQFQAAHHPFQEGRQQPGGGEERDLARAAAAQLRLHHQGEALLAAQPAIALE